MGLIDMACRSAASLLGRSLLLVLTYHRVLEQPDSLLPGEPDALGFAEQLRFLQRNFRVMVLPEALDAMYAGTLPPRAVAITFDDGYANNYEVAFPVLMQTGTPATFFVATGYLDGGRMWNDTIIEAIRRCRSTVLDLSNLGLGIYDLTDVDARRAAIDTLLPALKHLMPAERVRLSEAIAAQAGQALPDDLMMTSAQVRQLSEAGMDIGGHTVTHPILARVDDATVRQEVVLNHARLTELVGKAPQTFAYPNGIPGRDFLAQHPQMVLDCGYKYALTTAWGAASHRCQRGLVPRIGLWARRPARIAINLLRAYRPRVA